MVTPEDIVAELKRLGVTTKDAEGKTLAEWAVAWRCSYDAARKLAHAAQRAGLLTRGVALRPRLDGKLHRTSVYIFHVKTPTKARTQPAQDKRKRKLA